MVSKNAAAVKAAQNASRHVDVPVLGRVAVPDRSGLVFYAGLCALTVLELVAWPVALIVATGRAFSHQCSSQPLKGLGEALLESA
jgi:hypothetical protein